MIGMVGPETLLIVAAIVAVMFGGSKIPELARGLGQAKSEFHKGMTQNDEVSGEDVADKEPEPAQLQSREAEPSVSTEDRGDRPPT